MPDSSQQQCEPIRNWMRPEFRAVTHPELRVDAMAIGVSDEEHAACVSRELRWTGAPAARTDVHHAPRPTARAIAQPQFLPPRAIRGVEKHPFAHADEQER